MHYIHNEHEMEKNAGETKETLRKLILRGFNPLQYLDIAREMGITQNLAATMLWTHRYDVMEWEKQYERQLRET